MKLVGLNILNKFTNRYHDVQSDIESWIAEAKNAKWMSWQQIKLKFSSADYIKKNNIIFNLKGNKYRLWIKISFINQIIQIMKIGTHNEYDHWKIE